MSRGISISGKACGSFLRAQAGVMPQTEDEQALRVATLILFNMKGGNEDTAVALLKVVAKDGLEAAAKICTAAREILPFEADVFVTVKEALETLEEAQAEQRRMAIKKVASLAKQIAKLEKEYGL